MPHGPRHPRRSLPALLAKLLLLAWVALGAVHTGVSLVRQGFPPASPPALGVAVATPHQELAALNRLLEGVGERTVFLALPPSADTSDVLYLRYQLAHLRYPTRVLAGRLAGGEVGRASGSIPGPSVDFLVTRAAPQPSDEAEPSVPRERGGHDPDPAFTPDGWRMVARECDYVLWERPAP